MVLKADLEEGPGVMGSLLGCHLRTLTCLGIIPKRKLLGACCPTSANSALGVKQRVKFLPVSYF